MPSNVVVAVDLGYGHVKYAVHRHGASGEIAVNSFPSYVGLANNGVATRAYEALASLDLVTVNVAGRQYAVGKDSPLTGKTTNDRTLAADFSATDPYMALMMGALWHAKEPVIELLVVGLPMNTLVANSAQLIQRLKGSHTIPNFRSGNRGDGSDNIVVTIREVKVVGQPIGALLDASTQRPDIKDQTALVIDLGFNTLDVLTCEGGKPRAERSDAFPGGVAGYIEQISQGVVAWAKKAHPELREDLDIPTHKYEKALRERKPLLTGLGPIDLQPHVRAANSTLEAYMDRVANIVGPAGDITFALLAGGGAPYLEGPFRMRYPNIRDVLIPHDNQFSVVRGFMKVGLSILAQREAAHA